MNHSGGQFCFLRKIFIHLYKKALTVVTYSSWLSFWPDFLTIVSFSIINNYVTSKDMQILIFT